eukprot:2393467-Pyramimonas_sp.AAC.1
MLSRLTQMLHICTDRQVALHEQTETTLDDMSGAALAVATRGRHCECVRTKSLDKGTPRDVTLSAGRGP